MQLHQIAALAAALLAAGAQAEKYQLPPADISVVGQVQQISARQGETFYDIGREYGIGYDAMEHANQGRDPLYLKEGEQVLLPTRFILPDAPREGIVINLPEMRLYYYPPGENAVYVYAIGIGREGWGTPKGILSIAEKRANPPPPSAPNTPPTATRCPPSFPQDPTTRWACSPCASPTRPTCCTAPTNPKAWGCASRTAASASTPKASKNCSAWSRPAPK